MNAYVVVERIDNERAGNAENGDTDAAAAKLDEYENAYYADSDIKRRYSCCLVDYRLCVYREIEEARRAHSHKYKVVPRHTVLLNMVLVCRIVQKTDNDYAAHENGEPYLRQCR